MRYHPGDVAPKTCTCCMCGKDGNKINTVDLEKGQRFPPTPNENCYYEVEE